MLKKSSHYNSVHFVDNREVFTDRSSANCSNRTMLRVFTLLSLLTMMACTSPRPVEEIVKIEEREFHANFEEIWRATQQAIISYPLKINNMDSGQIMTTPIRGTAAFKPPYQSKSYTGGHRYTLSIQVIKVGPDLTKVSIAKDQEVARDFISTPEKKTSDGMEEKMILYRIGRELSIERTLLKNKK